MVQSKLGHSIVYAPTRFLHTALSKWRLSKGQALSYHVPQTDLFDSRDFKFKIFFPKGLSVFVIKKCMCPFLSALCCIAFLASLILMPSSVTFCATVFLVLSCAVGLWGLFVLVLYPMLHPSFLLHGRALNLGKAENNRFERAWIRRQTALKELKALQTV